MRSRIGALGIALLFLAACGPDDVGVTKGVDVIEIRAWAGPMLVPDSPASSRIANALLDLIAGVETVETVPDASIRSGARRTIRLSFLSDERAGRHRVFNVLLFFGADPESGDAAAPQTLLFRARDETDWNQATLDRAALRRTLETIGEAARLDLVAILEASPSALDAVRRSIGKLSGDRGLFDEDIQVLSVEARDWPNSALGFPREGMFYAQVIIPGHRVELRLPDGETVVCHTSANRVVADYE